MGFMEDDFNKAAKKMAVFGILALIVQGLSVLSAIIVIMFAAKHLFF